MLRMGWEQEYRATGHIVSTARKQRQMNTSAQLTLLYLFMKYVGPSPHSQHVFLPASVESLEIPQ